MVSQDKIMCVALCICVILCVLFGIEVFEVVWFHMSSGWSLELHAVTIHAHVHSQA